MSENRVFAVGLGFKNKAGINYFKTFTQNDKNHNAVEGFLDILAEELNYGSGNALISLENEDLDHLANVFLETGHSGSADFINEAKNRDGAFICIMTTSNFSNKEEEMLAQQITWK